MRVHTQLLWSGRRLRAAAYAREPSPHARPRRNPDAQLLWSGHRASALGPPPAYARVARTSGPRGVSSGRRCSLTRALQPSGRRLGLRVPPDGRWPRAGLRVPHAPAALVPPPDLMCGPERWYSSCAARGLQRGERCGAAAPHAPPRALPPAPRALKPRAAPSGRPCRGAQWAYSWPHTGKCSFNLRVRVHHEIWGFS